MKKRYDHVLETAIRLVKSMPDEHLEKELPDRPRSWRVLLHHVFQIPTAFLDMEESGVEISYENMVGPPPDDMTTSAVIAEFGEAVKTRFGKWATSSSGEDFDGQVPTYFGGTTRHEMLERTVWHSTQHVRQVAALLEQVGIKPDRALTAADIEGLPLTKKNLRLVFRLIGLTDDSVRSDTHSTQMVVSCSVRSDQMSSKQRHHAGTWIDEE